MFSSHPPTPERIGNAQREIANILPAREQYTVTTSELDYVKQRLVAIQARQKVNETDPDKPTLRKRTEQDKDKKGKDQKTDDKDKDDDRPVLKRRP